MAAATACFWGWPAATISLILLEMVAWDLPFFNGTHYPLIVPNVDGAWNDGNVFLICCRLSLGSSPYFSCMPWRIMFWVDGADRRKSAELILFGVGIPSSTELTLA